MRTLLLSISFLVWLSACNNNNTAGENEEAPKEVKQYTIEQFYKSSEVFGGDISSDDKKMLVTSNESGIIIYTRLILQAGKNRLLPTLIKNQYLRIAMCRVQQILFTILIKEATRSLIYICVRHPEM